MAGAAGGTPFSVEEECAGGTEDDRDVGEEMEGAGDPVEEAFLGEMVVVARVGRGGAAAE